MNCPNCGAVLPARATFCNQCGAKLSEISPAPAAEPVPAEEAPVTGYGYINPHTGFSSMTDSEPVLAALKKQRRAVWIAAVILVLAPLVGFTIYGAVSSSMDIGQAFVIGLLVSIIFSVITLISQLKRLLDRPFEGTVDEMRTNIRSKASREQTHKSRYQHLIWFRLENGKRKKKEVPVGVYNYLKTGDRVRYLPRFPQPFEKYKTAEDTETVCMFCSRTQPLTNDQCEFCHNPLIK